MTSKCKNVSDVHMKLKSAYDELCFYVEHVDKSNEHYNKLVSDKDEVKKSLDLIEKLI